MAGNPLNDPNWATDLANLVDRYVALVRDNVTSKVVTAVRALVFGIVVGFVAIALAALSLILTTKLLQRLLNIGGLIDSDSAVWVSYLLLGGILVLGGLFCMRKRPVPQPKAST
jgi:hypothetical protein